MPKNHTAVIAALKRYDRWCLIIGLALAAIGYLVSPGSAAFWLCIVGGIFIAASTYLNMAWGIKRERASRGSEAPASTHKVPRGDA